MVIMKQKESLVKIQKAFCVVEFIWFALLRGRLFLHVQSLEITSIFWLLQFLEASIAKNLEV